jgi:hypothetical protein
LADAAGVRAAAAGTAAEACNLGALIASDCGLPDLARDLCRRQAGIWGAAGPYDAPTAKLALQPLVNLARLHARHGDGTVAHRMIERLFTAVRHRTEAHLDGTVTDLSHLTRTPDDHRSVVEWTWNALLADGTRSWMPTQRTRSSCIPRRSRWLPRRASGI